MLEKLFDRLAADYDQTVEESDRLRQFPFAGYDEVLTMIANQVMGATHITQAKILDLGIGTGQLYQKLPPEKFRLYGFDISEKMLEQSRLRYPEAILLHHDFLKGIPEAFKEEKYDFIIATYSLHHLDLAAFTGMIDHLLGCLVPYGKILIGDVMFSSQTEKDMCRKQCGEYWDETEHYHVFSQLIELLDGRLALSFLKISFCAGVLVVENYHETALQMEDSLVQYNRNTVKWKSSQSGKKASRRLVQVCLKDR